MASLTNWARIFKVLAEDAVGEVKSRVTEGYKKRKRYSKWRYRSPMRGYYIWSKKSGERVVIVPLRNEMVEGYSVTVKKEEGFNISLTGRPVELLEAWMIADHYMATNHQLHNLDPETYEFKVVDRGKMP